MVFPGPHVPEHYCARQASSSVAFPLGLIRAGGQAKRGLAIIGVVAPLQDLVSDVPQAAPQRTASQLALWEAPLGHHLPVRRGGHFLMTLTGIVFR